MNLWRRRTFCAQTGTFFSIFSTGQLGNQWGLSSKGEAWSDFSGCLVTHSGQLWPVTLVGSRTVGAACAVTPVWPSGGCSGAVLGNQQEPNSSIPQFFIPGVSYFLFGNFLSVPLIPFLGLWRSICHLRWIPLDCFFTRLFRTDHITPFLLPGRWCGLVWFGFEYSDSETQQNEKSVTKIALSETPSRALTQKKLEKNSFVP